MSELSRLQPLYAMNKKSTKAFLLSALQPPAAYFTLALAGYYSSSVPAASLLVVLSLPPSIWFCSRLRHRSYGSTPAYASVVGHFVSALLTFIFKLLPVAGNGLGTIFFMTSCAFGVVFIRMIDSDPGRVDDHLLEQQGRAFEDYLSSDNSLTIDVQGRRHQYSRAYDNLLRGKYCQYCCSFIERYDHHCAAIQNCIGLKNTGTFLFLLTASCVMEMLYLECCYLYFQNVTVLSAKNHLRDSAETPSKIFLGLAWELLSKEAWVISIAVFVGLQISWQVPFLIFQLYLIGINLTTDEWVNWEDIPKFYKQTTTVSERPCELKTFSNPYDEGFISNYKAMLNKWK